MTRINELAAGGSIAAATLLEAETSGGSSVKHTIEEVRSYLFENGLPLLISRQSAPVSGMFDFSGLDLTPYSFVEIVADGLTVDTTDTVLYMQLRTAAGLLTSGYHYHLFAYSSSASTTSQTNDAGTGCVVMGTGAAAWSIVAGTQAGGRIRITNPGASGLKKLTRSEFVCINSNTKAQRHDANGHNDDTAALTGFRLLVTSGNILAGAVSVLGFK